MNTIPTALIIIAGLIVILLIVRATRPTNETLSNKVKKLEAERDQLLACLSEATDFLHCFGNQAQAERAKKVLKKATQPTGRKDE